MFPVMIYEAPTLDDLDLHVIDEIEKLRHEVARYVTTNPRRWTGHLQRMSFAGAVRGSDWTEGNRTSLDEVLDTVEAEVPLDAKTPTQLALAGYQDAMTYILQLATAPLELDHSLIRSLHYMMTKHELQKSPGLYRTGPMWVEDETGAHLYDAPDAKYVHDLMAMLIEASRRTDDSPAMVQAAMTHLNMAMIHPFRHGNGRMSRALQTLVMAREGIVSPVFSSIEEHLSRNPDAYYAVLTQVGAGSWSPESSAQPWIRFCLTAHYHQARTMKRRAYETESLYDRIEQLVKDRGLPPRTVGPLADAARGRPLRRSVYGHLVELTDGDPISDLSASRDLKALVDEYVLTPEGEGRGRVYHGSDVLHTIWQDVRQSRPPKYEDDPYVMVQ
jgi:Fic family protein